MLDARTGSKRRVGGGEIEDYHPELKNKRGDSVQGKKEES